jgi:hypothetical protein
MHDDNHRDYWHEEPEKPQQSQDKVAKFTSLVGFEEQDDIEASSPLPLNKTTSSQELLDPDDIPPERQPPVADLEKIAFYRNPTIRLVAVAGAIISVVWFASIFIGAVSKIGYQKVDYANYREERDRARKVKNVPDPTEQHLADLQGEIALGDQQRQIEAEKKRIAELQEQEQKTKTKAPPPPPPKIVEPEPEPEPPPPTPAYSPPSKIVEPEPEPTPQPTLSPEERYALAAATGTYQSTYAPVEENEKEQEEPVSPSPPRVPTKQKPPQEVAQTPALPPDTDPGTVISIGSVAIGKLQEDLLLAPRSVATIEIKDDLRYSNGAVALPEGTLLVASWNEEFDETQGIVPLTSVLVRVNGVEREYRLPPNSLALRGKNGSSVAIKYPSRTSSSRGFTLGDAIGAVGESVDLPNRVTRVARSVERETRSDSGGSYRESAKIKKGEKVEVFALNSFIFDFKENSR